jgi:hypothetical protein
MSIVFNKLVFFGDLVYNWFKQLSRKNPKIFVVTRVGAVVGFVPLPTLRSLPPSAI